VWASVREALAGSPRDFTSVSLDRAIFLLALPMMLEMVMESLFAVVDVFFVARLGADAVATVGLTESVMALVFAVALGLAAATTATVARRTGEKDPARAARAAVQAALAGLLISVLFGVTGWVFAADCLRLLGAPQTVVAAGHGYAAIVLGGSGAAIMLFLLNAVFRGVGDAAIAMRVLWLANGINIVLDPCLIFGWGPFPELGLPGAAVATTIGRTAGVVYQVACLLRGSRRIQVRAEHLCLDFPVLWRILRVSLPGMVQYTVANLSWVVLTRLVAIFGAEVLAGYTIAIRIVIFALLPSWGMSNAAATLVGQCLGARKPDRAQEAVLRTGFYNACFLGAVALLFVFTPGYFVAFFTEQPAVATAATDCLRIISYGYPFYAFGMVMQQAFNGAGDTLTPTVLNFFCYWLLEIPLAYLLSVTLQLGPGGVFWSVAVAEAILAVTGIWVFRQGRWKGQPI
jgi:putative MATE family efflux protein